MNPGKFFNELKRRNVFKVATAYAVSAWLIIQVVVAIEKPLGIPDGFDTIVIWVLLIGFPLALIIAWIYEWTNKGLQKTESVDADDSISSTTGKKLNRVIIASLSLLIVFLLIERVFFVGDLFSDEVPSIAVLPFVNQSSDSENDYFAEGIAEELLTELAQVEGLKVIARTSSFSFKGKETTIEEIANALGVDHIITGTVRKDGDQVRISVECVKVNAGVSLWSNAFDRELKAIFSLQKEIAQLVVNELSVKLLPEDEKTLQTQLTNNAIAYQFYLKARQYKAYNAEGIKTRIEFLKQAIQEDPDFAEAHATLARNYGLLSDYGNLEYEETIKNMEQHINAAFRINANIPEAYLAKAMLTEFKLNLGPERLKDAEADIRKAIELSPSNARAYNSLQINLKNQRKEAAADSALRKAWEYDPVNPAIMSNVAATYSNRGDKEASLEVLEKGLKLHPNYAPLNLIKIDLLRFEPYGKSEEAFILTHKLLNDQLKNDQLILDRLVELSMALDLEPVAQKYLNQLLTLYPENFDAMESMVDANAFFGDHQKSIDFAFMMRERMGKVVIRPSTGVITRALIQQEKYDKAIELIEEEYPEVLKDTVDFEAVTESSSHQILRNIYYDYTIALLMSGEDKRAQKYIKLVNDHDRYHDNLERQRQRNKSSVFEYILQEYEFSSNELRAQMAQFALEGKIDQLIANLRELYFNRRAYHDALYGLRASIKFLPYQDNPKLKALINEIREDIHQKRAVVIDYLKEQGEWEAEWDAQLD